MANKKQAEKQSDQAKDDGLVAMEKDGEVIRLDPGCVKDHERLGWIVSE